MQPDEESIIDVYQPDAVEIAACSVITPLLAGMDLAYARQNHARLKLPYATLEILGRRNVGMPTVGDLDDNGIQIYHAVKEGTLSVKFYGPLSGQSADDLRTRITKQTSRDIMRKFNFVLTGQPSIVDTSLARDGLYFERSAVIDIAWRYTGRYTDDAGIIEQVKADGLINDYPVNFTLDIKHTGA